jgi:hypothetical protein
MPADYSRDLIVLVCDREAKPPSEMRLRIDKYRGGARPVYYHVTEKPGSTRITFDPGPPFDGSTVLIHVKGKGWCEARWIKASSYDTINGPEVEGFEWCCLDDTFTADLDEADFWMPVPEVPHAKV